MENKVEFFKCDVIDTFHFSILKEVREINIKVIIHGTDEYKREYTNKLLEALKG